MSTGGCVVVDVVNGRIVLVVSGEVDISTSLDLGRAFDDICHSGLTEAVIDASQVRFIDVSGLRALIRGHEQLCQSLCSVHFVSSGAVNRIIELLPTPSKHLSTIRFRSREEALAAFEQ